MQHHIIGGRARRKTGREKEIGVTQQLSAVDMQ